MADGLDRDGLARMLLAAASRVRDGRERFAALDAATGDGDHGAAMSKVAEAIRATVAGAGAAGPGELLTAVAWAVMGIDGGSTGPLYGSLFMGMGARAAEAAWPLDAAGLAGLFEAGVEQLRGTTRARPGDKTLIDALAPAVAALRAAAGGGQPVGACLVAAAAAAASGAEATAGMRAAFGRARNIGERSIGHVDPGAASMAAFVQGLAEGYSHA